MKNEIGYVCCAMHFRRSSIAIQHDIILTNLASTNKDTISMNLFSSNKNTKLYLSLYLSLSIILSQLDIAAPECFDNVEAIQNMVSHINRNKCFTAMVWYKHGTINNRILVENNNDTNTNNHKNADNQVNTCQINYHIVQLILTNKKNLDASYLLGMGLEQLKYDVSLQHNTNCFRSVLD